jgi:hypothetical protein
LARQITLAVMAGLVPAITRAVAKAASISDNGSYFIALRAEDRSAQVFLQPRFVDGRDKPGHDVASFAVKQQPTL